jgi:hypothetical protein
MSAAHLAAVRIAAGVLAVAALAAEAVVAAMAAVAVALAVALAGNQKPRARQGAARGAAVWSC